MSKQGMIRVRIQQSLKDEAEAVLHELGISSSDAVRIFYSQIVLRHGLPFGVLIPNQRTQQAIDDAAAGRDLSRFDSTEAMFRDMGIELEKKDLSCAIESLQSDLCEASNE